MTGYLAQCLLKQSRVYDGAHCPNLVILLCNHLPFRANFTIAFLYLSNDYDYQNDIFEHTDTSGKILMNSLNVFGLRRKAGQIFLRDESETQCQLRKHFAYNYSFRYASEDSH